MKFENCKYDHFELAEKFLEMAEKFLPYAANEKYQLGMGMCNVYKNECSTVACHGGYAAIILCAPNEFTSYHAGAHALAKFFGFENRAELKAWAHFNPHIWGNRNGDDMFCSGEAFGVAITTATLKDIVSHYLLVAKNLMEIKE